jgi:hypothetical protein
MIDDRFRKIQFGFFFFFLLLSFDLGGDLILFSSFLSMFYFIEFDGTELGS